jgi:hypothetical protein
MAFAKSVGHPSVFSVEKENNLAVNLKDLAECFIGFLLSKSAEQLSYWLI